MADQELSTEDNDPTTTVEGTVESSRPNVVITTGAAVTTNKPMGVTNGKISTAGIAIPVAEKLYGM